MRIPTPYFKNVPLYGDLKMDEIVVEYDYPVLSILKDAKDYHYLCLCFDIRGAQRWLITKISVEMLAGLLENRVHLRDPFLNSEDKTILAVLNYETREETFQVLDGSAIPLEYLPDAEDYLDSDDGEWKDYIQLFRRDYTVSATQKVNNQIVVFPPLVNIWKPTVATSVSISHKFNEPQVFRSREFRECGTELGGWKNAVTASAYTREAYYVR